MYIVVRPHRQTATSYKDLCQCIADRLCDGVVKTKAKMDLLLTATYGQLLIDLLQYNVRLDCSDAVHEAITWHSEGFSNNIITTIAEYKKERILYPFRVLISGPPASGKSTVAAALSSAYKLHHIHAKLVIDEALNSKVWMVYM